MKRILIALPVIVALTVAGGCTTSDVDPCVLDPQCNPYPATKPVFVVPPCMEEDGPGPCFWDAQNVGNGIGTSYFIDANGEFYYPAP